MKLRYKSLLYAISVGLLITFTYKINRLEKEVQLQRYKNSQISDIFDLLIRHRKVQDSIITKISEEIMENRK